MVRGLIIIFILSAAVVQGQNIMSGGAGDGVVYLKPLGSESPAGLKRGSYVGPHLLGDTITQLLNAFEREYVYYKKTSGAYPVEEMVINKRHIYKTVHQLDDYFKDGIQKGEVTITEAYSRYKKILEIGLRLKEFETTQLEKDLKKIKTPQEKEKFLLGLVNL